MPNIGKKIALLRALIIYSRLKNYHIIGELKQGALLWVPKVHCDNFDFLHSMLMFLPQLFS